MKAHRLSLIYEVARLIHVGHRPDLTVSENRIKITRRNSDILVCSVPLLAGDD